MRSRSLPGSFYSVKGGFMADREKGRSIPLDLRSTGRPRESALSTVFRASDSIDVDQLARAKFQEINRLIGNDTIIAYRPGGAVGLPWTAERLEGGSIRLSPLGGKQFGVVINQNGVVENHGAGKSVLTSINTKKVMSLTPDTVKQLNSLLEGNDSKSWKALDGSRTHLSRDNFGRIHFSRVDCDETSTRFTIDSRGKIIGSSVSGSIASAFIERAMGEKVSPQDYGSYAAAAGRLSLLAVRTPQIRATKNAAGKTRFSLTSCPDIRVGMGITGVEGEVEQGGRTMSFVIERDGSVSGTNFRGEPVSSQEVKVCMTLFHQAAVETEGRVSACPLQERDAAVRSLLQYYFRD